MAMYRAVGASHAASDVMERYMRPTTKIPDLLSRFFQFVHAPSSPFTLMFSKEDYQEYVDIPAIRFVIQAIVEAWPNCEQPESLNQTIRDATWRCSIRRNLTSNLGALLSEPTPDQHTVMLLGTLTAICQTMIDESGLGFISVIEALSAFYRTRVPEAVSFGPSPRCLYDTLRILTAFKALALDECPSLFASKSWDVKLCPRDSGLDAHQLLHDFSSVTTGLAKANFLAIQWTCLVQKVSPLQGGSQSNNIDAETLQMEEDALQQGWKVMNAIQRLPLVRLEAPFYLPMTLVITLEYGAQSEFKRVETVISTISKKGFVLAQSYLRDVQLLRQFKGINTTDRGI